MSERTGCGHFAHRLLGVGVASGAKGEVGGTEEWTRSTERRRADGDSTDRSLQRRAEAIECSREPAADHDHVGIELDDDGPKEPSEPGAVVTYDVGVRRIVHRGA